MSGDICELCGCQDCNILAGRSMDICKLKTELTSEREKVKALDIKLRRETQFTNKYLRRLHELEKKLKLPHGDNSFGSWRVRAEKAEAKLAASEAEKDDLKSELQEARERKKENQCPDCGYQLESNQKDFDEINKDRDELEAENATLVDAIRVKDRVMEATAKDMEGCARVFEENKMSMSAKESLENVRELREAIATTPSSVKAAVERQEKMEAGKEALDVVIRYANGELSEGACFNIGKKYAALQGE